MPLEWKIKVKYTSFKLKMVRNDKVEPVDLSVKLIRVRKQFTWRNKGFLNERSYSNGEVNIAGGKKSCKHPH